MVGGPLEEAAQVVAVRLERPAAVAGKERDRSKLRLIELELDPAPDWWWRRPAGRVVWAAPRLEVEPSPDAHPVRGGGPRGPPAAAQWCPRSGGGRCSRAGNMPSPSQMLPLDRGLRSVQVMTAKRRHAAGMPRGSCSPLSSNVVPEPATRSTTVQDTRTSPGCAVSQTRHARWTAMPLPARCHVVRLHRCGSRPVRRGRSGGRRRGSRPTTDRAGGAVEGGEVCRHR